MLGQQRPFMPVMNPTTGMAAAQLKEPHPLHFVMHNPGGIQKYGGNVPAVPPDDAFVKSKSYHKIINEATSGNIGTIADIAITIELKTDPRDPTRTIPTLGPGSRMICSYALQDDSGAGIAICTQPWIPPLQDLLENHLSNHPDPNRPNLQGRFMLQCLNLENRVILIAPFYGLHPSSSVRAGTLLRYAYNIAKYEYERLQNHLHLQVTLLFMGDFNAFAFSRNQSFYESCAKTRPSMSSRTENARQVISSIEREAFLIHTWDTIPNKLTNSKYHTSTTACDIPLHETPWLY